MQEFNSAGYGLDIGGMIKARDVVVIRAGTGRSFTNLDHHIDYLMVRIDPDNVTRPGAVDGLR